MNVLAHSDTLDAAVTKLAAGNLAALAVLGDIVGSCRVIDPECDSPFAILIQLDRYKILGNNIEDLYKKVCGCDLVQMLALLRWAAMGRIRPTDLRSAIKVKNWGVPPPWYRPLDPKTVLSLVRAHSPNFGAPH